MTPHANPTRPRLEPLPPTERVFLANGYGMVGTGRTQAEANADLWEKIRQAREA